MKKSVRAGLIAVFLIVFFVSGSMMIKQAYQYRQGTQIYDDAQQLAGMENTVTEKHDEDETEIRIPEEILATLESANLEGLQEKNKDVFGWILIPGADISYPIVAGDDNTYYLTHTWDKRWNHMGAIFLEQECEADLSDFNTIIYGHNMKDTTMFSNLKKYMDEDFVEEAPYIYIATTTDVRRYDIFSAGEVDVDGHAFWIHVENEGLKEKFIDKALEMSEIETFIAPDVSDHILTLSTCTGNGHEKRMVVQAVMTVQQ